MSYKNFNILPAVTAYRSVAVSRRRYPDELASLTEDAVCGALYSWVIAEFDNSPEGKAFVAEMEEMRARRNN
jgi:hypothetical protein